MNRSRLIGIAAVVAVVALGFWWMRSRSSDEKPRYRTTPVERGYLESVVSATGTVRPVEQVEVGSQVSGTVNKLYADFNSRVTAGQVLLQLDPSSFRARLLQSEAAVARADAALKEANRQLARSQELVKEDVISQVEVEAAEVAVDQRNADVKQARAQLDAAQVDLNNSTIRAPINGVVISRSIELGQTVAASLQAPKLFVIANDLTQMQVETRIDEADIGQIHPGLPVLFTVDAFPDATFQGRVSQVRLEPIVEQNVVTYTTVIRTENRELKLRPGMTANVSVRIASRDDVLKIPNSALRFRPPASARTSEAAPARRAQAGETRVAANAPSASTPAAAASNASAGQAQSVLAAGSGAAPVIALAANESKDDLGRAELEKRMKDRGMPAQAIQSILERRDEAIAEMRKQGMSDQEIKERLRQRMEQMRAAGGGAGGAAGFGGGGSPSFRDFERKQAQSGAAGNGAGAKGGAATGGSRGAATSKSAASGTMVMGAPEAQQYKPGVVYVLRGERLTKVNVLIGLTDGAFTEVQSEDLKVGDLIVTGLEVSNAKTTTLTPPPGMGGGGGGGGRGR